jgi:hypothetical protein
MVGELDACAHGKSPTWTTALDPCTLTYSDDHLKTKNGGPIVYKGARRSLHLSRTTAANLLKLDPFYAGGQGASLDASRATQVYGGNYGAMAGQPPLIVGKVFTNSDQVQLNKSAQVEYQSGITSMEANGDSVGFWFGTTAQPSAADVAGDSGGVGAGTALTISGSNSFTTEHDLTLTYVNSTAVSRQHVTTANVTLNDIDNTDYPAGQSQPCTICHPPLPHRPTVNVFVDRVFGGFMFQDPSAPRVTSNTSARACCATLVNVLVAQEAAHPRFSDVPKSDVTKGVIGLMARADVLPGFADGTLRPRAPFARGDLAVALAHARRLPSGPAKGVFHDVPAGAEHAREIESAAKAGLVRAPSATRFGPSDPVTPAELSSALSRAFGTTAASGMLTSMRAKILTREDAAKAFFLALRDRP